MNSVNVSDNMHVRYFHLAGGKPNEMAMLLDCHQLPYYFELSKTRPGIAPYELFLNDPWFTIVLKDEAIADLTLSPETMHPAFHAQTVNGKGQDTLRGLEKLLDEGRIVPFETYAPRVPFYIHYRSSDVPYPPVTEGTLHTFVTVGHNEHELFYVEAPWSLNTANHRPCEDNESIGAIAKSDLSGAFDCLLNYSLISVDEDAGSEDVLFDSLLKQLASAAYRLSRKPSRPQSGVLPLQHLDSMIALERAAREGSLDLSASSLSYPELPLCELLHWKLSTMKNRRALLTESIRKHQHRFKTDKVLRALHTLDENKQLWEQADGILKKLLVRKDYSRTDQLAEQFRQLLPSETIVSDAVRQLAKASSQVRS